MKRTLSLRLLPPVLLLAALVVLAGCGNTAANAATVNGHDISVDDVTRGVEGFAQSKMFRDRLAEQGVFLNKHAKVPTSFASQWLTSLIQSEIIAQIAKQRGVSPTAQETQQAKSQFAGSDESAKAFRQLPQWLQDEIVHTTALQLSLASSIEPAQPTEQQLAQAYAQLEADCPTKKLVGHILVKDPATAQQVVDELGKGTPFATVAEQVSTDTGSASRGGILTCEGSSQWSQLDATFRAAAEATSVGTVSEPVQTQFGYHVIEGVALTPESGRVLLEASLQQQDPLAEIVAKRLAKAKVWVNPRFGKLNRANGQFAIVPAVASPVRSRPSTSKGSSPAGGSGSGSTSTTSTP